MQQDKSRGIQYNRKPIIKKDEVNLDPTKPLNTVKVKSSAGVGKSITILMSDGTSNRQLTIHHPIGYTQLEDDEWIADDTSEIPRLLSRAEHPGLAEHEELIRKKLTEFAIHEDKNNTYTLDKDGKLHLDGEDRAITMAKARKAANDQWKADHPIAEAKKGEPQPHREKQPEGYVLGFLPSEKWRIAEKAFQEIFLIKPALRR